MVLRWVLKSSCQRDTESTLEFLQQTLVRVKWKSGQNVHAILNNFARSLESSAPVLNGRLSDVESNFFPLERNEFSIWYYRVQSAIEFQLTKRFVKKNDLWLLQFKKRRLEWRRVWFWILWLEAFDTVCWCNGANKSFVRLDFAIRILQKNFAWKFLQKNFPWIVCEDRRSGKISEKSFAKEFCRRIVEAK